MRSAPTFAPLSAPCPGRLAAQLATTGTPNANSKNAKPVADVAREIFDEASTLMTKTSERLLAMNTEHVQQLAKLMEETLARATAGKSCCNG